MPIFADLSSELISTYVSNELPDSHVYLLSSELTLDSGVSLAGGTIHTGKELKDIVYGYCEYKASFAKNMVRRFGKQAVLLDQDCLTYTFIDLESTSIGGGFVYELTGSYQVLNYAKCEMLYLLYTYPVSYIPTIIDRYTPGTNEYCILRYRLTEGMT